MPYVAQVLQILIASPGDVSDERELITQVIHEWNYLNSRERSVVLLPLRWETHSYPEISTAPQVAINKQVVDYCDMAIGVFWTRLGTPTEKAESGTAEEIARVADAGKPVMLYFSEAKVRPQSIDRDQFASLMEFRETLTPNALIESYGTIVEFRDKLRMHLDRQVKDIISQESGQQDHAPASDEKLILGIVARNILEDVSAASTLNMTHVTCKDRDQIPDYLDSSPTLTTSTLLANTGSSTYTPNIYGTGNVDYYREMVDYYCKLASTPHLWLAVANPSDHGVRDIHLDIKVKASGSISINPPAIRMPTSSPYLGTLLSFPSHAAPETLAIEDTSHDEWRIETDIAIVQARRTVLSSRFFFLQAEGNGNVTFTATTYSSEALPFVLNAELRVVLEPIELSYRDILKRMIPGYGEGASGTDSAEP